ncbi:MAG: DUF3298 domain-containing protein [Bacteroidaceae bacterium]|nr:DUF3298 domain-containing protein [Bacteroidaceae bacterium]
MNTKTLLTGVATMVAVALCMALTGCEKENDNVLKTNTLNVKKTEGKNTAEIKVDFPLAANPWLQTAITEYISETLGGTYEGEMDDAEALANHYAQDYLRQMAEVRSEVEGDEMEYSHEARITKIYETERLVTYSTATYAFYGGAHGSSTGTGMTFRKSDGRRVGMNLLNDKVGDEEWMDMVRGALKNYFEVKTDDELHDCLQLDPDYFPYIPMPESEPWFSEEGMVFSYQQYEIACYAAGMPAFVVPYEKLHKYLNVTGRRLVE